MDDELIIEKVCRYVPVVTGLKSAGVAAGSTVRHMLISIPRLKFLETGETDYYHKYRPPSEDPVVTDTAYSRNWCDTVKVEPLTPREKEALNLKNDGYTYDAIANRLNVSRSSAVKILTKARVKTNYINQKG